MEIEREGEEEHLKGRNFKGKFKCIDGSSSSSEVM